MEPSRSLGNGDGQRTNPGNIWLFQGIKSDNHRSEGHKRLSMSRYSCCQRDVSRTRTAWLVTWSRNQPTKVDSKNLAELEPRYGIEP
jgi:hypothetical protein